LDIEQHITPVWHLRNINYIRESGVEDIPAPTTRDNSQANDEIITDCAGYGEDILLHLKLN